MGDVLDASAAPEVVDVPEAIDDYLRELRMLADASQREMAVRARVPLSTIAGIESGVVRNVRLDTLSRLVSAAGCTLAILDWRGQVVAPRVEVFRDLGGRRLPAHLDVRPFEPLWDWPPYNRHGPHTFDRNRDMRDWLRAGMSRSSYVGPEMRAVLVGELWEQIDSWEREQAEQAGRAVAGGEEAESGAAEQEHYGVDDRGGDLTGPGEQAGGEHEGDGAGAGRSGDDGADDDQARHGHTAGNRADDNQARHGHTAGNRADDNPADHGHTAGNRAGHDG